jgi:hypothetical protein
VQSSIKGSIEVAIASYAPPRLHTVDEGTLPLALLDRFEGDEECERLVALLRLLGPITTTPGLDASAS